MWRMTEWSIGDRQHLSDLALACAHITAALIDLGDNRPRQGEIAISNMRRIDHPPPPDLPAHSPHDRLVRRRSTSPPHLHARIRSLTCRSPARPIEYHLP